MVFAKPFVNKIPCTVQNKACWIYPDEVVWGHQLMQVAVFFIRYEDIWRPYFGWISEGKVFQITCKQATLLK